MFSSSKKTYLSFFVLPFFFLFCFTFLKNVSVELAFDMTENLISNKQTEGK